MTDDEVEALARELRAAWNHHGGRSAWENVARFVRSREAALWEEMRVETYKPPAPDAFKARVAETAREIAILTVRIVGPEEFDNADVGIAWMNALIIEKGIEERLSDDLKGGAA